MTDLGLLYRWGVSINCGKKVAHRWQQQQGRHRRMCRQRAQVNVDETSFGQGNRDGKNPQGTKGWLWVMVTPLVSYFAVCLSRSGAVCQQLLGDAFAGIVGSDR